ncbi:hypothetical protein ONZ45_g7022 [Pleurotus djamor]|nr:hypothetical protein ONZ45_g7022 [Pleurotus djamor]
MARGRPRLYHTPEDRLAANRVKSKRSYDKHKKLINIRRTVRYRSEAERKRLMPGAPSIPASLYATDLSGWVTLAKDTNVKYKLLKNGTIRNYVETLCQRYLNADNHRLEIDGFEAALLEIGSYANVLTRCHDAMLQSSGVGSQIRMIRRVQRSVRDAASAIEDVIAHAMGGYVEFAETYQLRQFIYQSYLH